MKRLGVFLLPPGWDASPSQGYTRHCHRYHLCTWVERGTVRVKCLAQDHNTLSPNPEHSIRSRALYNHKAIAPPTCVTKCLTLFGSIHSSHNPGKAAARGSFVPKRNLAPTNRLLISLVFNFSEEVKRLGITQFNNIFFLD